MSAVMLKRCEEILERSVSAPSGCTRRTSTSSPVPSQTVIDVEKGKSEENDGNSIASLLKDDNLCAWSHDFLNENEKTTSKRTQNNKKYDILKPNVTGLQVRKSHFYVNSRYRNSKHSKDKPTNGECSFVHYTDATQYVEEYRRLKLERLKKEYEMLTEGTAGGVYDTNATFVSYDLERQKTPPTVCYPSYGTSSGAPGALGAPGGYHLDSWSTGHRVALKEEKKRELLSYIKVRGGGRCSDQHESDAHLSNFKPIPVASCKPISICNLFPYDHSTNGSDGKVPGPSSSTKSRDVGRKQHQNSGKSPVKMTDDSKKGYRHSRHSIASSRKENEYCHIIKKVFDHTTTAKLTTSTTSRNKKSEPETKFNYVLTPS